MGHGGISALSRSTLAGMCFRCRRTASLLKLKPVAICRSDGLPLMAVSIVSRCGCLQTVQFVISFHSISELVPTVPSPDVVLKLTNARAS